MSTFICATDHISALAGYAMANELWRRGPVSLGAHPDLTDVEALGLMLHDENAKSVSFRYRGEAQPEFEGLDHNAANRARVAAPIAIIKSAHCYRYQACEHDEWEESEASRLIKSIEANAVSDLPGYDDAKWGAPS